MLNETMPETRDGFRTKYPVVDLVREGIIEVVFFSDGQICLDRSSLLVLLCFLHLK